MQKLQNLLLIFLFLLKDPQLHLTNISTHNTHLGLTDARVGDTSRGNQNIQDIKCEFKDTIVLTCVRDRIILSRDKFEMEDIVEMPKLCPGNFEIICEGALSKYLLEE